MLKQLAAAALALTLAACATPQPSTPAAPRTLTLSGQLTRADHQTYRELPFTVPAGVRRITIRLTYDRENRTVVDLGLRDPAGQRGWSGGNKSEITIAEFDATPSYRAGPITPGRWTLLLGVPNIREGSRAAYTATITFDEPQPSAFGVALGQPGWFRGDLHMHTGHSDGSCPDPAGARIPCPVIRTLEAARNAHLDFIAVTDHNTLSHLASLRELQPAFPNLLLIPGEEITTFHGHANAFGVTSAPDFQFGSPRLPSLARLIDQLDAQGAILSINHPAQPSDESCMGCGWTADPTPWRRIAAIEAVNGGSLRAGRAEGPGSGLAWWQAKLDEGLTITAIGGSDNHDATDAAGERQSPIGRPTTVVWSEGLSQRSILAAIRSGRVFIDMDNVPGRMIDISVRFQPPEGPMLTAPMGGAMAIRAVDEAELWVSTAGLEPGARIEVVAGAGILLTPSAAAITASTPAAVFHLASQSRPSWIRANIRAADGRLLLVSNPVYILPAPQVTAR
jgi:hypothetical protein